MSSEQQKVENLEVNNVIKVVPVDCSNQKNSHEDTNLEVTKQSTSGSVCCRKILYLSTCPLVVFIFSIFRTIGLFFISFFSGILNLIRSIKICGTVGNRDREESNNDCWAFIVQWSLGILALIILPFEAFGHCYLVAKDVLTGFLDCRHGCGSDLVKALKTGFIVPRIFARFSDSVESHGAENKRIKMKFGSSCTLL